MAGAEDGTARRPTLYDVARVVGVSHQTVSRVVKGHPNVRPEVRQRIEVAIEQLGYKPNLMARSLATSKPHRIGALVYELLAAGPSKIMEGASIRARESGYLLDIVSLDPEDENGISAAIDLISGSNLAGVLAFTPTDQVVHALRSASFGVPISLESETSSYGPDGAPRMGESGVELMIQHLAELGHRRFFHIAGPDGWLAARGRASAYEAALASRGLESVGMLAGDWSAQAGHDIAMSIPLDVGITAIVAANDQSALGAMSALEGRGVRVPEDISVVGFDDIPESQFFHPPLTTVRFEFAEQGRVAIDRLIARINGETPEVLDTTSPTIVTRRSSGPAASK